MNNLQNFYGLKTAMRIEIAIWEKDGKENKAVFISQAPAKGKNESGNQTFDWEEKKTIVKMSTSEMATLAEAVKVWNAGSGQVERFKGFCKNFNGKSDLTYVHDIGRGVITTGLQSFAGTTGAKLSYFIKGKKDDVAVNSTFTFSNQDLYRLERYLSYILNIMFHKNM